MTAEVDPGKAAVLRRQLAEDLQAKGVLRSPEWRAAVESVPRHRFVPSFFQADGNRWDRWVPVTPQRVGVERWLELAYSDASLVTLLDDQVRPGDADGPVADAIAEAFADVLLEE